jgi:FkbM family methyltransferase
LDAFKKRGFPLVQGALYTDRNALERLCRLFSTFEYITTNATGSHIAYAAYLGAKVSIYGSYAGLRDANYNNVPAYLPLMDKWNWASSEEAVRQYYPELFCHPWEANEGIEWGKYELGFDNKVTPAQLRSLFGWTFQARLTEGAQGVVRKVQRKALECVKAAVPFPILHRTRMIRSSDYRQRYERQTELQRLEHLPRYTGTATNLLGESFELVDAKSFLAQYKAIFDQQIYRFETRKEAPLIIDGGANVGLSVLHFKRSFPKSRIIAFEPDPDIFHVLSKNCAAFQLENVQLIPKAIWTQEGTVEFDREGADAGRIVPDTNSILAVDVGACRLTDYLDQEVDLLKLDLEGAELDVLMDCADRLSNVQKLVVEYHSFEDQPQKLHVLAKLLHDAGFRLHVTDGLVSSQPLWFRQVKGGMDMRLYLYGFRA